MARDKSQKDEPRQWLRLIQSDSTDPLEILKTVGVYQRYLNAIEERAVKAARATGKTWEEIASSMGMRRQSVWEKYRMVEKAIEEVLKRGRRKEN